MEIQRLGEYVLTKRIGLGGMAEVFRAWKLGIEGFEKMVVIKRILPNYSEDREFVRMLIDEARLVARLTHQNIVEIYDFGRKDDNYFISMEYIMGQSLDKIRAQGKKKSRYLSIENILYIVAQTALALEYAHTKTDQEGNPLNIVHRDVSPQNILISYEGEVKLVDFGIAKAKSRLTSTESGVVKGKVPYMSPEQLKGEKIDHRSDIFSLGIILYELLTKTRLFKGEVLTDVFDKILKMEIIPPSTIKNEIPYELDKIVMRCLEREPDKRYQSALELYNDIVNVVKERGLSVDISTFGLRDYIKSIFSQEIEEENREIEEEYKVIQSIKDDMLFEHETQFITKPIKKEVPTSSASEPPKKTSQFHFKSKYIIFVLIPLILIGAGVSYYFLSKGKEEKKNIPSIGTKETTVTKHPPTVKEEIAKLQKEAVIEKKKETPIIEKKSIPSKTESMTAKEGEKKKEVEPEKKSKLPEKNLPSSSSETPSEKVKSPKTAAPSPEEKARAIIAKAIEAIKKGKNKQALDLFSKAFSISPGLEKDYGKEVFKIHLAIAKSLRKKDIKQAIFHLKMALTYIPNSKKALFMLANYYLDMEDFDNAMVYFKKLVKIAPDHHKAHFNLGYIYLVQGKYPQAAEEFLEVIKLKPPYLADAYVNLGIAYLRMKENFLAREACSEALKLDPNSQPAKQCLSLVGE